MAGKTTIECPACFAKLSISDPSKLGKKIKCPKCQEIFTPEAIDEDLDEEDDEPKTPSSRKRAAGGSKGSSKKGGKGNASEGSNTPLILTALAAVLVIAGVGLYFSGVFGAKPAAAPVANAPAPLQPPSMPGMPPMHGAHSPPMPVATNTPAATAPVAKTADQPGMTPVEKTLGLRWLPKETDLIVHAKLSEVWNAPLLKAALNGPGAKANIDAFKKMAGVAPADIESVTIGFVDLTGSALKAAADAPSTPMPAFGPPMMRPQDNHYIVVVKSKTPVDLKTIAASAPNAKMKERSGKSYLEIPAMFPGDAARGAWSPEPTTTVMASTKELFDAMDRGETVAARKEFTSIDHQPQIIIAAAVRSLSKDEIQLFESKQRQVPEQLTAVTKWVDDMGLQMAQLGLTIKGGFDLKVAAACRTADGATKLKSIVDESVAQFKTMFAAYEKTAPPLIGELGQILVSKLKVETTSDVVSASTGIPDSEQAKLEQLPTIVMMLAMTGGLNNLGGPPGGVSDGLGNSPFAQMPGETQAVDAVKSEGLPDGSKLSAKTAWSIFAAPPTEGANPISVEILIDVTGDGLESVCAASGINSKTMTLEGGVALKKLKRAAGTEPFKTFAAFDINDQMAFDHPPNTLRVRGDAEAPAAGATKIDVLEGSFKILTSADAKEFTIDEVPKKIKRPLSDPDLKAMEVKLRRGPTGVLPETIAVLCGKDHFLGKVVGTPGDIVSISEVEKDLTVQKLTSTHEGGKFPDDFQIKFTVHPQVKEQTVTFRFENVPLPTPESKPQIKTQ